MNSPWRFAALALAVGLSTSAVAAEADWMNAVGTALGKSGSAMPGGVYRVGLARTDLKVTLDGVEIKPALALGSWLAFTRIKNQGMVMGDLVANDDVNKLANGLKAALANVNTAKK